MGNCSNMDRDKNNGQVIWRAQERLMSIIVSGSFTFITNWAHGSVYTWRTGWLDIKSLPHICFEFQQAIIPLSSCMQCCQPEFFSPFYKLTWSFCLTALIGSYHYLLRLIIYMLGCWQFLFISPDRIIHPFNKPYFRKMFLSNIIKYLFCSLFWFLFFEGNSILHILDLLCPLSLILFNPFLTLVSFSLISSFLLCAPVFSSSSILRFAPSHFILYVWWLCSLPLVSWIPTPHVLVPPVFLPFSLSSGTCLWWSLMIVS